MRLVLAVSLLALTATGALAAEDRYGPARPQVQPTPAPIPTWQVRPADWPPTRYEAKALEAGRAPAYLEFEREKGTMLRSVSPELRPECQRNCPF